MEYFKRECVTTKFENLISSLVSKSKIIIWFSIKPGQGLVHAIIKENPDAAQWMGYSEDIVFDSNKVNILDQFHLYTPDELNKITNKIMESPACTIVIIDRPSGDDVDCSIYRDALFHSSLLHTKSIHISQETLEKIIY